MADTNGRCNYVTGMNRIGNGFNGHTGDSYCKKAATTTGIAYQVRVGFGMWAPQDVPMCDRHAELWARKSARLAKAVAK